MYNFDSENNFFFNIDHLRGSKIFFQIELFKSTVKVKGDVCEFGVFKGNSLNRLILLRTFTQKKKKFLLLILLKKLI